MSYTTAAKVRAVLPDIMKDDDDLGVVASGTSLTLTAPALDVPTILKNATTLTKTTDYTFVRPTAITINVAATGERFIAQVYRSISDTDIETIIAQADRIINDYFYNYDGPGSGNSEDWSSWLSAAIYLRIYGVSEDSLTRANALEKMARDGMAAYRENTLYETETGTHREHRFVVKVN